MRLAPAFQIAAQKPKSPLSAKLSGLLVVNGRTEIAPIRRNARTVGVQTSQNHFQQQHQNK